MKNENDKPSFQQATKEESEFLSQFKTKYVIGFDKHGNSASYCLAKHDSGPDGDKIEIILSKYIETDSELVHEELKCEVRNLGNYFDAEIIKEIQDGE